MLKTFLEVSQSNKDLIAIKSCQKTDNDALKKAVENRSQKLEEKVTDEILQLGNQVTSLKSELKKLIDTYDHDAGDDCFHGTTPPDEATLEARCQIGQLAELPTSPVLDRSRG